MMTGKEKSELRRTRAKEAISAFGIPGVTTTRNLEKWLMDQRKAGRIVEISTYVPQGMYAPERQATFTAHPAQLPAQEGEK